ncbi:hypothetical protein AUEXF2481DRAFT_43794 [Aureobasidium subglaciale EXF-2481]|uniref:SWR1-complex protein 3 domain-containing protein n=1 Tax=Aureobasidium subglaciale (strain EXF-2481) TaxID=1043005 RepID=A0A074Y779_AURSE|nr:uncharacterized protein AUEXF2481DRAFT_43794 [Aureobasidium subglaciale EXF-2481]KAI5196101.1 hypothetical protein E4T38_08666 [Aureobasidium subglaciale]KAI5214961.1 hypothetical protein E4T40_08679 [Aureobasidium subglaciale]KAI5218099.1 hypothetical protein E4T41_08533 [Aureobasidium subglaciale]KAI5255841.1 hypothetical protein E4T46_08616 [Aureobasidium subglaciale]KEQ91844.1 hypothetical protein AUEXF2481DRAFT_43794 [Aureobasidium subglaciale EXF-2481]
MAEKRRASGRARDAKRRRTSTKAPTPKDATPQEATPVVEEVIREATPLPNKVVDSRLLPTLSERQPNDLSNDEYKSIAESGVLLASLERSRQKWISGSFFEKYWTKTSGRKDAPPAPPGNPHKSWMKEIGPCTLVVEPMIFEATAYYVKEPGPTPSNSSHQAPQQQQYQHQYQHAPQQFNQQQRPVPNPPAGSPYGAPYSHPSAQFQGRPHPPPIMPATARAPPPPPAAPAPAKQSPDPVIQMLASRASSDPELKALMKIVATGNANQEQLRIFQRHIDELTAMINANKAQPASQTNSPAPPHQHAVSRPPSAAPVIKPHPATVQPNPPLYPMPQQHPQYSHQPPPPPRYPSYPIVLEFLGPNASPDRFRFPEYTILEFLNSYKMLASFLVIRKGRLISPQLEPETEYYEPVTMTISVPEGRSAARDVLQFITRCVKPADQVRNYMMDQIEKCTRAPTRHLAFRLPHKSGITEAEEEVSVVVPEVKPKPRPVPRKKKEDKDNEQAGEKDPAKGADTTATPQTPAPGTVQDASAPGPVEPVSSPQDGAKDVQASTAVPAPTESEPAQPAEAPATDSSIAKRKKSVRISEIPVIASDGNITTANPATEASDAPTTT